MVGTLDEWGLLPPLPWRGNRKNFVRSPDFPGGTATQRVPLRREGRAYVGRAQASFPPRRAREKKGRQKRSATEEMKAISGRD
jgi:hypothetical protein